MRRLSHLVPAVTFALALSLGAAVMTGCSSGSTDEPAAPVAEETKEEATTDKEATPEAVDSDDEAETDTKTDADASNVATQHVGADGVGFVDIPADWKPFQDASGGDDLQWCDGTPYTIVTLNVIELSEQDRASLTLDDAANNIAAHLLDEGMDEESLNGAHVTLAGRDATQLYGMYPDGSVLVVWLLEDDSGNYRYVSAEGTTDTVVDAVSIVEVSYAL